jgi:uncharacterized protein with von Willebrand factor type A (vWA) domain
VETILQEMQVPPPEEPPSPEPPGSSKDPLRRPLGAACARASRAVEELRDAIEGLAQVEFMCGHAPGTGTQNGTPGERPEIRPLAARLKNDERLRRIAALAGRFKRIAASKRRQRVKHGADEVTDIEQGSDLARALPSELSKLSHRLLRLDFMRSMLEGRVLQYQLSGSETLGKGPLIVILDKSGSMDGPRDIWATALALALLDHAQRERRMYALLGFDYHVKFEAVVKPGEPLPEEGLFVGCSGGTDISAALTRGLEIIRGHPGALRKADLVLVTDGGSDPSSAPKVREEAAELGVTILGLGIGVEREWLLPWCDEVQAVSNLSTVDDAIAAPLFAA